MMTLIIFLAGDQNLRIDTLLKNLMNKFGFTDKVNYV